MKLYVPLAYLRLWRHYITLLDTAAKAALGFWVKKKKRKKKIKTPGGAYVP